MSFAPFSPSLSLYMFRYHEHDYSVVCSNNFLSRQSMYHVEICLVRQITSLFLDVIRSHCLLLLVLFLECGDVGNTRHGIVKQRVIILSCSFVRVFMNVMMMMSVYVDLLTELIDILLWHLILHHSTHFSL